MTVKLPPGGVLALDWGGAKVGYATVDELGIAVTPRGIFRRKSRHEPWTLKPEDLRELRSLMEKYEPGLILLGLPLNADGSESEGSAGARRLATELTRELKIDITLVPEILTSWAARGAASNGSEDAEAAALLIRDYMGGRGSS